MDFYNNTYQVEELNYKDTIYPNANVSLLAVLGQVEDFDYEVTSIELLNDKQQPIMILVDKDLDKWLTPRQTTYLETMFLGDYTEHSINLELSELENNAIMRQQLTDYL